MSVEETTTRLAEASSLEEVRPLLDEVVRQARQDRSSRSRRRALLRALVLSPGLARSLQTGEAIGILRGSLSSEAWTELFGPAVEKELPGLVVAIVDSLIDVDHEDILSLVPENGVATLVATVGQLSAYLGQLEGTQRRLRGMRAAVILASLFGRLQDGGIWRRRSLPACAIDSRAITALKEKRAAADLPAAYEARVNELQREDMHQSLEAAGSPPPAGAPMAATDRETLFEVRAPLRLGLSSANASDNHIRSKEQGGKTLNAGIVLQAGDSGKVAPPLYVGARPLPEPRLVLRSRSADFQADFEIDRRGDARTQSDLFFAYRRGGDEALRMVKQGLVHTGIVRPDSDDVVGDLAAFRGGGGLEITTACTVQQGSGLGTSSILAAAILKVLYRLVGHPAGGDEGEYPGLYDQSVLLEHSIGLNSGWQDARGARGGPSAVKDFYAPPTDGLPAPELTYIDIDAEEFRRRVVLFDTGIARGATRGLNVVMEAYLGRRRQSYGAIRESLSIHDEMVEALRAGDYGTLGRLASRYWQLRCILDPRATSPALQQLFEPPLSDFTEGGTLTGAGGGGFGLFVCREGEEKRLHACLRKLRDQRAHARSGVVAYRLDATGLQLTESPSTAAVPNREDTAC